MIKAGTNQIIDVSEYASLRDFERRYVTDISTCSRTGSGATSEGARGSSLIVSSQLTSGARSLLAVGSGSRHSSVWIARRAVHEGHDRHVLLGLTTRFARPRHGVVLQSLDTLFVGDRPHAFVACVTQVERAHGGDRLHAQFGQRG
jgi:hypothetical protein